MQIHSTRKFRIGQKIKISHNVFESINTFLKIRVGRGFFLSLLTVFAILVFLLGTAIVHAFSTGVWIDHSGCAFTVTYSWSGFNGAKAAAVWIIENQVNPKQIAPTYVEKKITGKSGTIIHTFPAIQTSGNMNTFRAWGQLLDSRGNPITDSIDFSSLQGAFCTV